MNLPELQRRTMNVIHHPYVPAPVRDLVMELLSTLAELDNRLTKLERSNDGDGRQAR